MALHCLVDRPTNMTLTWRHIHVPIVVDVAPLPISTRLVLSNTCRVKERKKEDQEMCQLRDRSGLWRWPHPWVCPSRAPVPCRPKRRSSTARAEPIKGRPPASPSLPNANALPSVLLLLATTEMAPCLSSPVLSSDPILSPCQKTKRQTPSMHSPKPVPIQCSKWSWRDHVNKPSRRGEDKGKRWSGVT